MTYERRLGLGTRQVLLCLLILVTGMTQIGCGEPAQDAGLNPADEIWREIIPEEGAETIYGIPLSLDNTQQFIGWFNTIELSTDEQLLWDAALSSLVAPCCDDYPMSTC